MTEQILPYSKFLARLWNIAFHLGFSVDLDDDSAIAILKDSYGFDFGKMILNETSLSDSVKIKARNLLFVNSEKIELWQNGELLEFSELEGFMLSERSQKNISNKFFAQQVSDFDKEKVDFISIAKLAIQNNKEEFQKNPTSKLAFHEAIGKLLNYIRKYLNPQANRNDVIELAVAHYVCKLILQNSTDFEKVLEIGFMNSLNWFHLSWTLRI